MTAPERKLLFNPGPATTTQTVKNAQVVSDICPRESEFAELVNSIRQDLTGVGGLDPNNYAPVLFGGSGTAAVESMLTSIVPGQGTVLVLCNGAYGRRMAEIARRYSLEHDVFTIDESSVFRAEVLRDYLKKSTRNYRFAAVVHHETSSGLLNPLDELDTVLNEFGIATLVDAMSIFGVVNYGKWLRPPVAIAASSNKCLHGMAGLGIVLVQNEILRATLRPATFYLDLQAQATSQIDQGQFRFTPPVQSMYALKAAIDEWKMEGIDGRYLRYTNLWHQMVDGLAGLGVMLAWPDQPQSKILAAFKEPDWQGFSFNGMHEALFREGITIYPGKIGGEKTFRLSVIGDLYHSDIKRLVDAIARYKKTLSDEQ